MTTLTETHSTAAITNELAKLIADHREALAKGPDLPPKLADALIQSGLTQLWLPQALGGAELAPLKFVQTMEALAKLDGAVAWCSMISSAGSRLLGLTATEPMRRLLSSQKKHAFSGSAHPTGIITREGDGWRVNGSWALASFSRYSTITAIVCVEQQNGAPRLDPKGGPILRAAFISSSKVQVMGNWNSGGLRSSGSHDITCTDVPVRDADTTTMDMPCRQPGPLYSLPMPSAGAIAIIGLPLGIAAASIEALVALARTKVPFMSASPLCEQEHVQLEVAWAKTHLLAARALAFETVGAVWDSVSSGEPASLEQQALLRMACCNAGEVGKQVVSRMYAAAGSTALSEQTTFAAQLRDISATCQHISFANRLMISPGRMLLGLDPGKPML